MRRGRNRIEFDLLAFYYAADLANLLNFRIRENIVIAEAIMTTGKSQVRFGALSLTGYCYGESCVPP
jgi:hypothetical protein